MRSPVLALLAPAFAAFTLLTGAGATAPTQTAAMPTFKRQAPAPLGVRLQSAPAAEAGTLLDEVGRLSRRVEASEASNWKRELQGKRLKLERLARLHLWLGEYKLAHEQDPAGAYWHFRTINRMPGKSPELARLKGRAVLDIAIGRFKQGAYEEATHR